MNVFDKYAGYYDLLYHDKNYQAEVDYIDSLLRRHKTSAQNILELGCGTGIHAAMLAAKGHSVLGVDISEGMLKRARARSHDQKIGFAHGDARDFRTDKKFDTVVSLFHVMSYQNSNADVAAAIQTANIHLDIGGHLIFDFWYAPAVLTQLPEVRVKRLENETIRVIRLAEPQHEPNRSVVHVCYEICVEDKLSNEIKRIHEKHSMRYFSLPEVQLFLERGGFELKAHEEWLTGKELGVSTWGACVVAQKTKSL